MATIVLSMSGDGRGHATRARALVERLRGEHEVVVLAPGDAWELLAPAYAGTAVRVERIPCMRFRYRDGGRLDALATGRGALPYLRGLPSLVGRIEGMLREVGADLAVTDFEPALPRAARRAGIPFVSVTHQHLLVAADLSFLPAGLRARLAGIGLLVRAYYRGAAATVVSSFHVPPLRRGWEHVVPVGVLLREGVARAAPSSGEHVVAYFRRSIPPRARAALERSGREVRVYGLGERGAEGRLRFLAVSEEGFVCDLASSAALVCTAGNQLVGEALHLEKPVLAIPEAGNAEQLVNAHLLAATGAGRWEHPARVERDAVERLLERQGELSAAARALPGDGTPRAVEVLRAHLPAAAAAGSG